jgi:hypothetical protein
MAKRIPDLSEEPARSSSRAADERNLVRMAVVITWRERMEIVIEVLNCVATKGLEFELSLLAA